jgi:hypothetical protein
MAIWKITNIEQEKQKAVQTATDVLDNIVAATSEIATINGVLYRREDQFWNKEDGKNETNQDMPDIICKCGNDTFTLHSSGSYELSAKCSQCGTKEVVYDG